jgi:hypothetical protein
MNYLKTYLPYLFGNKEGKSYVFPHDIDWDKLNFEESLMMYSLNDDIDSFINTLDITNLLASQIFHLFSYKKQLDHYFFTNLTSYYPEEYELFLNAKKDEVLKHDDVQDILNYKNYELSLFAIFREGRHKPGKIFVKDSHNRFIHNPNGSVWSIPILGVSGRGLPFNHSNGTTPCGVFIVDSVMPEANQHAEFGKFRRLIVNFIAQSPGEDKIKQMLPTSHYKKSWWLQSVMARELGRSLLRIHGTGTINKNPFTPYFPMIPSSGCLTTTETHLIGLVQVNHQRNLLDTLMKAQGLPVTYENESKIHGVLYVIDFDGTYQTLEFKS